MSLSDLVEHVYNTITGSLCTDQGTAKGETFTCEHTLIESADSLVLSEEISDLTSANTDITSRYICVCTDIFTKLCHKALAECHNLSVRFTFRIEVGATFSAADRKTCKRVFEDLLKTKEFQDTLIYRRMESQAALVWSDRTVELDTVSLVNLYSSVVIDPRYFEGDDSLWLYKTLKNGKFTILFLIFVNYDFKGVKNFLNCLMEFWLARILCYNSFINFFCVRHSCFLLITY